MHTHTIKSLQSLLAKGEFSSHELTLHYIARIEKYRHLNTFITPTFDLAIEQAKNADAKLAANKNADNPLLGIPVAHKDIFCTKGVRSSGGSKMLDNFISPYDAKVVENTKQAGMVMLGKLNMDEMAMGSSNETSYYNKVLNPWDTKRVPGGSSGGSAAAVAAMLTPAATGTDTGGSIRQPASFCNVTGFKPTYGTVSRYGMIAFASSLDQAGPIAKTAEDCGLLLQQMAGFDERDSTSINKKETDYNRDLEKSLQGLKIGLPQQFFNQDMPAEVAKLIEAAIAVYKDLGAKIIEVDLPNLHLSVPVYYVVAPAECSSNLSRLDGVRFGYRAENVSDLEDLYCRSRSEAFGSEVKRRILMGTYVLSAGFYDAYYLKAQKVRQLIAADFQTALQDVDLILSPTTPEVAFEFGAKASDPVAMYLSDIYTIAVNLAGLPAISVPAGFINNLPLGMQLIGNHFQEARILNAAHQYQRQTNWHLTSCPSC